MTVYVVRYESARNRRSHVVSVMMRQFARCCDQGRRSTFSYAQTPAQAPQNNSCCFAVIAVRHQHPRVTWIEIAAALGVSPQAARQRYIDRA